MEGNNTDEHKPSPAQSPRSRQGNFKGSSSLAPGHQTMDPNRPASAVNRRGAPMAAQAFFRPMSSQRLQAQRGTRSTTAHGPETAVHRLSSGTLDRPSLDVRATEDRAHGTPPRPVSRGTDVTEDDLRDRGFSEEQLGRNIIRVGTDESTPRGDKWGVMHSDNETSRGKTSNSTGAQDSESTTPFNPQSYEKTFDEKLNEKFGYEDFDTDGKNYEFFGGNAFFCFGGRFLNSHQKPVNIATGLLMVIPTALFLAFSAKFLWDNVSPALPVVYAYIFYVCMSSFVHASVSDPGVIPRNLHPMAGLDSDDPLHVGPSLTEWVTVKSVNSAMVVPTKYCKTCKIWRPPRTHHCRACDSCIETQDHHCLWLNNCVGRRNYRYFFSFVASATALGLYLSLASLGHILKYSSLHDVSFSSAIGECRVPFAMFIYGIIGIIYPVTLLGYHLFLASRGETTREYLTSHKLLPKDRFRPFDHANLVKNWFVVFFRPRPPTYMRFKAEHVRDNPHFGDRRAKGHRPNVSRDQVELRDVGKDQQKDRMC